MKSKIYEKVASALLIWTVSGTGFACSPTFPNTLLDQGDGALLAAPVVNFASELDRMKLPAPAVTAMAPTNSRSDSGYFARYAEQSRVADLADLRAALTSAHVPESERENIIGAQGVAREKLQTYLDEVQSWKDQQEFPWRFDDRRPKISSHPKLEGLQVPQGLPAEFEDYFRGLVAYREGNTNEARSHWRTLLARPKADRKYRTTWAAFMLGRTCSPDEPETAIRFFQTVRQLAKQGFPDSLGLAEASLGWEAQVNLKQKKFARALELYLQQYAAGEPTALNSLRFAAQASLKADAKTLLALATNPSTRRVITAYVIGFHRGASASAAENDEPFLPWLEALENAEIQNVEEAEQLALAAYQNGRMELAQRWINRSLSTPTSQWLQAKLYLRAGQIDRAASILQRLTALFPVIPDTNETSNASFEASLFMDFRQDYPEQRTPGSQVLGELGALHLARREYRESVDCLLRSDYWMDAAYIADEVLTVDELKSYVDASWPSGKEPEPAVHHSRWDSELPAGEQIRGLLARRLTRLGRGHEARQYFQPEGQTNLDNFLSNWEAGQDQGRSAEERGHALFEAAKIARESGMELMGAELDPDWFIHGGSYEYGLTGESRTNSGSTLSPPTQDEINRWKSNQTVPNTRFHYRYTASGIAWQAAALMPNNSDETAKILWTAGCWLKDRDPKVADAFYKSLVRRCRKTELGEEADRIRWFPVLDESGKIIPGPTRRKEKPPVPADAPVPLEPPPPDQQ